jgi:hypothetical protein
MTVSFEAVLTITSVTTREVVDRNTLRRLLLRLFALGTNMRIRRSWAPASTAAHARADVAGRIRSTGRI